jgi:hypothetical protein
MPHVRHAVALLAPTVNNKDHGLERMTLEGLVRTLEILVEARRDAPRVPLEAAQAELESTIDAMRRNS